MSIHRQQVLKERMAKYKIYEDYLMKTLDYLPSSKFKTDFYCPPRVNLFCLSQWVNYTLNLFQLTLITALTLWLCPSFGATRPCPSPTRSCCSVWGVWRRRWSRASGYCGPWKRSTALKNWSDLHRYSLQRFLTDSCLNEEEFFCVLQMANKELSELQSELETLKEKNKQAEVNLLIEQGLSREKVYYELEMTLS